MSQYMIYCDDVDENVAVAAPVARKVGVIGDRGKLGGHQDQHGGKPAQGRTVLGSLQSNAARIQPQRAVKSSKVQPQENTCGQYYNTGKSFVDLIGGLKPSVTVVPPPALPPAFTIFEDDSVNLQTQAVASQACLAVIGGEDEKAELFPDHSPMTVDEGEGGVKPYGGVVGEGVKKGRVEEIEERLNRVLYLPEYTHDIYRNLRETELRYQARPDYMRRQQDLTHNMRTILVDWLVEVAEEYKLHRETLFLAVNYIDRFLSVMSVVRAKLQLVGTAAIFLAAKYEEIYPPDVNEFVYITDDTYTKKQILQMEKIVLKALTFDVAPPTAAWFCQDLLNEIKAREDVTCLAMYLLELTLLDGDRFLRYLPSVVATTCVCLANYTLGISGGMKTIREYTGYDTYDIKNCTMDLFYCYHEAANLTQQSIRDKYKQPKAVAVQRHTKVQIVFLQDDVKLLLPSGGAFDIKIPATELVLESGI